ncbi:hypothetical protein [Algicola sagamiensis]|uniref:hypothetical protein n=1 Tax=Algicola sagamiensis TaxID=163869 RepID=UPI00036716D6|nr:hypothetical protein [Algicola sagamiensis]
MKNIAYALISISFLSGSFICVLDPEKVNWFIFVPLFIVGCVGVVLLKSGEKKAAQCDVHLSANMDLLSDSIKNIVKNLEELNRNKESLPPYEARFEIDRLLREDLTNFAESRNAMVQRFGLQHYADVMSGFAAGERYVNRVWSASTDGYVDEVKAYLEKALIQFRESEQHFEKLFEETKENA